MGVAGGAHRDESWASKSFHYRKPAGAYLFTLALKDAGRILGDFSDSESIALFFGPTGMTELPLDASDAIAMLRECAAKLAAPEPGAPPPG